MQNALFERDQLLKERQKELSCLYTISHTVASDIEEKEALTIIANALTKALQKPELAVCAIFHASLLVICDQNGPLQDIPATALHMQAAREQLSVHMYYTQAVEGGFLDEERYLLESTADICVGIAARHRWIQELREAGERLNAKNVALRELLNLIEEERQQTAKIMETKLAGNAIPLLRRLKNSSLNQDERKACIDALEHELSQLSQTAELAGADTPAKASLSLREREIIRLLRNGRNSREIAEELGLSPATIDRHRHNIRKKLGLVGSDANLAGYLLDGKMN